MPWGTRKKQHWSLKVSTLSSASLNSHNDFLKRVKKLTRLTVMSTFTCQLDWTKSCPVADTRLLLGMSVTGFLEESTIWTCRPNKEDPHSPLWASIVQLIEGPNRTKRWRKGKFLFSFVKLESPSFPALVHWSSWFSAFGLVLNYTNGFLGSPVCRQQIVGLCGVHNCMSQLL